MKKYFFIVVVIMILVIVVFSGCQEQEAVTTNRNSKNIFLESSVVELAYSSLDIKTKYDYDEDYEEIIEIISGVDVHYRFRNIAGRDINVGVTVEFYDKNNNLLEAIKGQNIHNLFKDAVERSTNTVSYGGEKVSEFDHATIIVVEI